MPLFELDGISPTLAPTAWVAPGAQVIGQVSLGDEASVWFNAVIRGDNDPIVIGNGVNIQDGCVLHSDPGFPLHIADGASAGHMALLHGCTIGEGSLVGMGAVILNGAVIGKNCLIGANALITEGKQIPDNSLVMGQPGKVVRTLDDDAAQRVRLTSETYRRNRARFAAGLRPLD